MGNYSRLPSLGLLIKMVMVVSMNFKTKLLMGHSRNLFKIRVDITRGSSSGTTPFTGIFLNEVRIVPALIRHNYFVPFSTEEFKHG